MPVLDDFNNFDELKLLQDEWNDVYSDSLAPSPLLSFDNIFHWFNCFVKPEQIIIYRVIVDGVVIGFLPLVVKKNKFPKVLSSLTNDHCLLSNPIVRRGYHSVFPELLLSELCQDYHNWDVFSFSYSYSFSPFAGLFSDELMDKAKMGWHRQNRLTYVISLEKSFAKYFQEDISAKFRKNIKMYRNRFKKSGVGSFSHYQEKAALDNWLRFVEIEDSGWKGEAGSSIKRTGSDYQKYYDGLILLLNDKSNLDLFFLDINEKAIAGVFGYKEGDIFHCSKTGYDENFKEFSPSNLLIIFIIEYLIKEYPEINKIHMFPWNYGYKHRFSNSNYSCSETIIFSKTLIGRICFGFYTLKEKVKMLHNKLWAKRRKG